jgi:hypothetical protein
MSVSRAGHGGRSRTLMVGGLVVGFAFVLTARLHWTGLSTVVELASSAPRPLPELAPALWIAFSIDLVVLGLIAAVVSYRPGAATVPVLALASICPLGAAGLQMKFLGFMPPTAILLGVGAASLVLAYLAKRADPGGHDDG